MYLLYSHEATLLYFVEIISEVFILIGELVPYSSILGFAIGCNNYQLMLRSQSVIAACGQVALSRWSCS